MSFPTVAPSLSLGIPDGWFCPDSFFGDSICDCFCGATDIDCLFDGVDICQANTGSPSFVDSFPPSVAVDSFPPTTTIEVPEGWICPDSFFNDGICDCQCGAPEDDCLGDGGLDPADCDFNEICVDQIFCVPQDGNTFAPSFGGNNEIPDGWICPDGFFNDGVCDCQCGAPEDDCLGSGGLNPADCDFNEICVDQVICVPQDGNTLAPAFDASFPPSAFDFTDSPSFSGNNGIPDGWICPDGFFNDGFCDCQCGAPEDDCLGDGGLNPFDCGPGEICVDQVFCINPNATLAPSTSPIANPTLNPTKSPVNDDNNGGNGDQGNNEQEEVIIIILLALVVVLLLVLICATCICLCNLKKRNQQPLEEVGYVATTKGTTLLT